MAVSAASTVAVVGIVQRTVVVVIVVGRSVKAAGALRLRKAHGRLGVSLARTTRTAIPFLDALPEATRKRRRSPAATFHCDTAGVLVGSACLAPLLLSKSKPMDRQFVCVVVRSNDSRDFCLSKQLAFLTSEWYRYSSEFSRPIVSYRYGTWFHVEYRCVFWRTRG